MNFSSLLLPNISVTPAASTYYRSHYDIINDPFIKKISFYMTLLIFATCGMFICCSGTCVYFKLCAEKVKRPTNALMFYSVISCAGNVEHYEVHVQSLQSDDV